MKANAIITIVIAMLLLLTGCAGKGGNNGYDISSTVNDTIEDLSDADATAIDSVASELPPDDVFEIRPEDVNKAYADVIAAIIQEHGIFEEARDSNGWDRVYPKGFFYGELIDFDQDGIDEMVCAYSPDGVKVLIRVYQFDGKRAQLLMEQKLGIGFFQTDEGGAISYLELDGRHYLIIEIGQNEDREHILIITTSDRQLTVKEFLAYPAPGRDWWSDIIDQEMNIWDVLTNYEVDGQAVSREDFIRQYESYFQGSDRSNNVCRWIWLDTYGDISLEQATGFFEKLQSGSPH